MKAESRSNPCFNPSAKLETHLMVSVMRNLCAFVGGKIGKWRVLSLSAVKGASLDPVARIDVLPAGGHVQTNSGTWTLQGQISNLRYATRAEVTVLRSNQEQLGRESALRAALIPIKKTAAWWDLPHFGSSYCGRVDFLSAHARNGRARKRRCVSRRTVYVVRQLA